MQKVKNYLLQQVADEKLPQHIAKELLMEIAKSTPQTKQDIAIIGISGKFPGAADIDEYWDNLLQGKACIGELPKERQNDANQLLMNSYHAQLLNGILATNEEDLQDIYILGGYLNEIDKFDADFFRIPPKEAEFMDPLQRVFLETAMLAIEDSGYGGNKLYGGKVGVYVGKDHTNTSHYKYVTEHHQMHLTGSWAGILASRISYIYNFQGPSMVIDTACSSGLVAVHQACQAINDKKCELAIAGGIHISIFPGFKAQASQMDMVESNDGIVRTFDNAANGTVWGEGSSAVLLKPLSKAIDDGDHIYAVIKGGAVNNDGASNGITAPNAEAQEKLIIDAWQEAKVEPDTIGYIETHGTGTVLGDPIEIKGITNAFRRYTDKKQFCGIGSVKTNIGHLVGASGMASLIKVVMSLKNGIIPPSLNFQYPNQFIHFCDSPVFVNDTASSWDSNGKPRRAGVSSFGFSGTNCHLVLEEAPPPVRHDQDITSAPGLLKLSAKSRAGLEHTLNKYVQFVNRNESLTMQDICYTANTGRGDYLFRIAFTVQDMPDLRTKLNLLVSQGIMTIDKSWFFYGEHTLVPPSKKVLSPNELTEKEKKGYTLSAMERVQEVHSNPHAADTALAELCRLYIKGAEVEWETLYAGSRRNRVSLPPYPLERLRYWASPNVVEFHGNALEHRKEHPLVHRRVTELPDRDVYETRFSVNEHWVLSDHKVMNMHVVPGTTYLEMFKRIFDKYYKDAVLELSEVTFIRPLAVHSGEEKTVLIIVEKGTGQLNFTIVSKMDNEQNGSSWITHVQGCASAGHTPQGKTYSIEEIISNCGQGQYQSAFTNVNGPFEFGPRWFNSGTVYLGTDEIIAEMNLPIEFKEDLNQYYIHPAMMDCAVNVISQSVGDGIFLPLMYKRITVFGPMPPRFFSYVQKRNADNKETISFDIELLDENGNCFMSIADYTIKRVSEKEFKRSAFTKKASGGFAMQWYPSPLGEINASDVYGQFLVFKDRSGWADHLVMGLRKSGIDVIEVESGEGYQQLNHRKYTICEDNDYSELFHELKQYKIQKIIHAMSISKQPDITALDELKYSQRMGVYSVFNIARSLSVQGYNYKTDLITISDYVNLVDGKEEAIKPHNAPLFGLTKVVGQENENITCRNIDIDWQSSIDLIIAEIMRGTAACTAYRQNQRYLQEMRRVSLNPIGREVQYHTEGVYVITGGAGGIGFEIGKHLTAQHQVEIALIGRTVLPERNLWKEILHKKEDMHCCAIIKRLTQLEQAGAKYIYYKADISNGPELEEVLNKIRSNQGAIKGIIHTAGVAGKGLIYAKDTAIFDEVISPKVYGTWLLGHLTRNDALDFFTLFSSVSSLLGGVGQSDYTAANSYLDSYAMYRNHTGLPGTSISWPLWKGVGMAAEHSVSDENQIFLAMSAEEAITVFEDVQTADVTNILPGCINFEYMSSLPEESLSSFSLSEDLRREAEQRITKDRNNIAASKEGLLDVNVIGLENPEKQMIESRLAIIWGNVLGLEEIQVYQTFYNMGGDSILAMQLLREIDKVYPQILSISDIFTYSTIVEMSDYIRERTGIELEIQTDEEQLLLLLETIESGNTSIAEGIALLSEKRGKQYE
ncbi:beta-ketoacyl synthase N-terminal-like domain-containing protein [Paenibacillus sp. FSL R7-0204]|uniref:type I polyketide synthase n=1 Tax=Paenibacillus sp. FSL R7-0204 TaxID=2921675 RepID=UPI0030F85DBD